MNDTIPVPLEMVSEILGYTAAGYVSPSGLDYTTLMLEDGDTYALTLPQLGEVFQLAWDTAADGFDADELIEGADPVAYALDSRSSAAERLRDLILWASEHIDPMYKRVPPKLTTQARTGIDFMRISRKGAGEHFALLRRVAPVRMGDKPTWVIDQVIGACSAEEMSEVLDQLGALNDNIRRGVGT